MYSSSSCSMVRSSIPANRTFFFLPSACLGCGISCFLGVKTIRPSRTTKLVSLFTIQSTPKIIAKGMSLVTATWSISTNEPSHLIFKDKFESIGINLLSTPLKKLLPMFLFPEAKIFFTTLLLIIDMLAPESTIPFTSPTFSIQTVINGTCGHPVKRAKPAKESLDFIDRIARLQVLSGQNFAIWPALRQT